MVETDVTADESHAGLPGRPDSARVILSLQSERPHDEPLVLPLQGVQAVWFSRGRGPARAERAQAGSEVHLKVEVPDRFLSSNHASLQRVLGSWLLEDQHSRNGTFVDGQKVERHELTEGTVFEIGHTFCVFRGAAPDELREGAGSLQPAFAAQLRALERAAPTSLPVVLRGETGTGKEVLARTVHRLSGRKGEFQPINCAALAPALVESELFGYKKGAFSGALEDRPGLIRSAHNGTLFLDEIGDLPLPAQGALLRVLQESEVTPVGGTKALAVDFRLVVATHRDLEQRAASAEFRPDLLARLTGFTVLLPPLRERPEDLGALVSALLARHAPGRELRFTQAAARALFRHVWPLNVRELEKALRLAAALSVDGVIDLQHLPPAVREAKSTPPLVTELPPAEAERRDEILVLLREHHGNVTAVAKVLGKARVQVQRWMRKYNIRPSIFR
ncbi:MAG TPA: sigma 54-interacting transcriptional regulator [Myxococcales bacterium]|nr:sigma 54-interacting transcriptional regulator [Myxococcales bacterium]